MKFNIEIDITPEEMRQMLGLPNVEGLHQQMLDQFVEGLETSTKQREEFMRSLVGGVMDPWQAFSRMANWTRDDQSTP